MQHGDLSPHLFEARIFRYLRYHKVASWDILLSQYGPCNWLLGVSKGALGHHSIASTSTELREYEGSEALKIQKNTTGHV